MLWERGDAFGQLTASVVVFPGGDCGLPWSVFDACRWLSMVSSAVGKELRRWTARRCTEGESRNRRNSRQPPRRSSRSLRAAVSCCAECIAVNHRLVSHSGIGCCRSLRRCGAQESSEETGSSDHRSPRTIRERLPEPVGLCLALVQRLSSMVLTWINSGSAELIGTPCQSQNRQGARPRCAADAPRNRRRGDRIRSRLFTMHEHALALSGNSGMTAGAAPGR